MSWANEFVGIPYLDLGRTALGCDCWGLARLVYAERLKIDLPSCTEHYTSSAERAEVSALLATRDHETWTQVSGAPSAYDLLLFRRGCADSHVGIAINCRMMLHMSEGDHAKIESQIAPRWSSRFVAAFRHVESPFDRASNVLSGVAL